jgi:hypothetical protein
LETCLLLLRRLQKRRGLKFASGILIQDQLNKGVNFTPLFVTKFQKGLSLPQGRSLKIKWQLWHESHGSEALLFEKLRLIRYAKEK